MSRKAAGKDQPRDAWIGFRNLYRDWSRKGFTEDHKPTIRRTLHDIRDKLGIAHLAIKRVIEQFNRAMPRKLI